MGRVRLMHSMDTAFSLHTTSLAAFGFLFYKRKDAILAHNRNSIGYEAAATALPAAGVPTPGICPEPAAVLASIQGRAEPHNRGTTHGGARTVFLPHWMTGWWQAIGLPLPPPVACGGRPRSVARPCRRCSSRWRGTRGRRRGRFPTRSRCWRSSL